MAAMNRQRLLDMARLERVKWKALLDEVGPARMLEPGACGDWTMRDLVFHTTIWLRHGTAVARAAVDGRPRTRSERFGLDLPPEVETLPGADLNRWMVTFSGGLPVDEIIASEQQAFDQFAAAVGALADAALLQPVAPFPDEDPDGRPLWQALAQPLVYHFREHGDDVRAWLNRTAANAG